MALEEEDGGYGSEPEEGEDESAVGGEEAVVVDPQRW